MSAPGGPDDPGSAGDPALRDLARLCDLLRRQLDAARAEIARQETEIVALTRLLAEHEAALDAKRTATETDAAAETRGRSGGLLRKLLGQRPQ